MRILFVSDPAVRPNLRRLWLDGAAHAGVGVLEVAAHRLALQVDDDGCRMLLDGGRFEPDAVMLRSTGIFMPLVSALAAVWEAAGVLVVNPVASINTARDKVAAAAALVHAGVKCVPTTGFFRAGVLADTPGEVVVKPAFGSQGRGVALYTSTSAAMVALGQTVRAGDEQHLVAQPFWGPRGHDLRCFVVNGRCVASMRRHNGGDGFENNASRGGPVEEVHDPEAAALAVAATEALGLWYAGVDIVESEPRRVLEVNALPSFVALEAVTGVNPAVAIWEMVRDALAGRAA